MKQRLRLPMHRLISHWVARFLERRDLLERDTESSYLMLDEMDVDPMQ